MKNGIGVKGLLTKHSTSILTGVSVGGLCSTAIFAVRSTPKALRLLELEEEQVDRQLTKKEIVAATWKCYIPSVIMGTVTIGCIVSINKIGLKRNAALTGLYSVAEKTISEYQDVIVEKVGKKKAEVIKDEVTKNVIQKTTPTDKQVIFTGNGETLCYESITGRYFKSDIEDVRRVENEINKELIHGMYFSLNDLFYRLDLPSTAIGETFGWIIEDGMLEFDISSHLNDKGVPCLAINYSREPVEMF